MYQCANKYQGQVKMQIIKKFWLNQVESRKFKHPWQNATICKYPNAKVQIF